MTSALLLLLQLSAATSPRVLSEVDGAGATPGWKYVRLGQTVALQAEPEALRPGTELRWLRLDPVETALDNTQPTFQFKPITYRRVEIAACRNRPRCAGSDALAHLRHSPVPGTGTTAFALELRHADGTVERSADEATRVLGGLGPAVHRITVRRDDSYLGHLTELFGTPYIFGSSGVRTQHQTDLLIGSDCADLAVYGMRRLGKKIPYVSTWTIDQHATEQLVAEDAGDGTAEDAGGRPVKIGAGGALPGDLLLFPKTRHVGVLYEDRAPKGQLDENDLLLHTCWAKPTVEPLRDTGCASYPIRVLRFPTPEAARR